MNGAVLSVMVEAAVRALAAAVVVWCAMRLLRVHNVPAQKAAWSLVLVAALGMPFAMRWNWVPAVETIRLPALTWGQAKVAPAAAVAAPVARTEKTANADAAPVDAARMDAAIAEMERESAAADDAQVNAPVMPETSRDAGPAEAAPNAGTAAKQEWPVSPLEMAWGIYLAVTAVLVLRLMAGLIAALRIWFGADRVDLAEIAGTGVWSIPTLSAKGAERMGHGSVADAVTNLRVRWSGRVSSPVNVASGVVLPEDFRTWDAEKLRVVLAHERSHVRQGDFYLQLVAGLYAAVFWFSPLGWWLKRKLSELGEAIGDRAGLEEAGSRSSYVRLLLEFAATPRPTLTGVAMAREGKLASRIERLLNESIFSQAFAAGRRRALVAVLLAPAVLFAAAALVRVQAAGQAGAAQLPAQGQTATSQDQTTGVSQPPEQGITEQAAPAAQPPPPPAAAPEAGAGPQSVPAPAPLPMPPGGAGKAAPQAAPVPMAPNGPVIIATPEIPPMHIVVPGTPPMHVEIPAIPKMRVRMPDLKAATELGLLAQKNAMMGTVFAGGYPYFISDGGDAWALVTGPGQPKMHVPASQQSIFYDGARKEIDKARKMAKGPFLWFEHDGKSYVVDDPSVVTQVEAMQKPMEDVRSQMEALKDQERALSKQMRDQMQERKQAEIPKPDLSKEMAELNAAVDSLKASQGNTISEQQLMELQKRIAEIQGRLAGLEGRLWAPNAEWSEGLSKLSVQMAELGGKQGHLAEEMARLAVGNRGKIGAIIEQSLKDGKAKAVK